MTASTLTETLTSLVPETQPELRERYAQVGDVTLHYVEAGDGPLAFCCRSTPGRTSGVGHRRCRVSKRIRFLELATTGANAART
jgi:hypothetical protein